MGDDFHPCQGNFDPTFILKIPDGTAQGQYGWTIIDNTFIREMVWKNLTDLLPYVYDMHDRTPCHIAGTVVVLGQPAYMNYYHMLSEVLCRLALVEKTNIAYDKVYIPQIHHFFKEALELWGLKKEQIINTFNETFYIQADTLILPSLVSNVDFGLKLFSCYPNKDLLLYVRQKLLNAALKKQLPITYPKKIFISRKDAPFRKISNEDAIFALLKLLGFQRYVLDTLDVTEQILLFHHAKIVIGTQGTSLANCLFCKPNTKVFEIFQSLNDSTISHVAEICDLKYIPIKTMEFSKNYGEALLVKEAEMPLDTIQQLICELQTEEL